MKVCLFDNLEFQEYIQARIEENSDWFGASHSLQVHGEKLAELEKRVDQLVERQELYELRTLLADMFDTLFSIQNIQMEKSYFLGFGDGINLKAFTD